MGWDVVCLKHFICIPGTHGCRDQDLEILVAKRQQETDSKVFHSFVFNRTIRFMATAALSIATYPHLFHFFYKREP